MNVEQKITLYFTGIANFGNITKVLKKIEKVELLIWT